MAVTLSADVLRRYPRFSLYNSPYPAHDRGCAIDLYPAEGAPSPVAGEVIDIERVRAPSKPYAADHDHLILVDIDESHSSVRRTATRSDDGGECVARVLHVEPTVGVGDRIAVGDSLGALVRAGFFAPWVDNHIHLGFRASDSDPYRASGSLPIDLETDVEPVAWDGAGRVRAVGETYAVLDTPSHPAPDECFAGIADDTETTALDGGLPHYDGGGALAAVEGGVSLLGSRIGVADGRDVRWDDIEVRANGEPVTGISLFAGRTTAGAKLVHPNHDFAIGESIEVTVRASR